MIILYPGSILRNTKVDEFFEEEYISTSNHFDTCLVDQNDFHITKGKKFIEGEDVLYRGWIVTPEQYNNIYQDVKRHNGNLVVSPEEYQFSQFNRSAYGINGWTEAFSDFTPRTILFDYDAVIDVDDVSKALQYPLVIKGSSKSVKHDWDNAMFIKNKDDFYRVVDNYKKHVNKDEDDVIMIREFEDFVPDEEYRLWFYKGKLAHIELHDLCSGEIDNRNEVQYKAKTIISEVEDFATKNNIQLLTVDLAKSISENYRILECGSGMVSGSRDQFVDIIR